ncbi:unnamed protein product [Rotaria sordida]|uniref:Alpha-L-arabinofuranosidase B arabinose-binding domain-containing protein n=1 Tax=Rotaria sordida TaxID=392033 RepID=A0A813Y294_9BILA|nr:unnamed protein product [Rotaria sordida]CAF0874176.1 unnamed protein product [Rotaria sordida]
MSTFSGFISTINLFLGIFMLFIISTKYKSKESKRDSSNLETYIKNFSKEYLHIESSSSIRKPIEKELFIKKDNYDHYFRIDYTIEQAICQPLNIFHSKKVMDLIQTMTAQELNGMLTRNVKIQLDLLRIHATLLSSKRIKDMNNTNKLICNYMLELFVGINFSSYCDDICQTAEVNFITSNKNLFGDLPNSSLKFSLSNISPSEEPILYYIHNVALYRTVKYIEKALFIQSTFDGRYISTKYFRSNDNQSLISMSTNDKSLFIMKKGLNLLDPYSVYVSFLSLSSPNWYIRHEDAQIKISKNDNSHLFKQDATFKLLFDHQTDTVVFQTINLSKKFFITLNNQAKPDLILSQSKEESTISQFDKQFTFKLISS